MGFTPSTWFAKSKWIYHPSCDAWLWLTTIQIFREDFAKTDKLLKDLGADIVLTYDDIPKDDEGLRKLLGNKVHEIRSSKVAVTAETPKHVGSSFGPRLRRRPSDKRHRPPCG